MNEDNKVSIECIGRFQFAVPGVLTVTGRNQNIYNVDVSTVSLESRSIETLWRERLDRIRKLPLPEGKADPVIRTFELEPGVSGVWYFPNQIDPELLSLEAVKKEANHAILLSRSCMAGKEGNVEKLLKYVLGAYVPSVSQGFCLGYGAVTSEPGLNEHAGLSLKHMKHRDFEITFNTRVVNEPDTRTYSNLDEEKQVTAGLGGRLQVLRDQTCFVAGLEGIEIWASVMPAQEPPFVRFTWHFPGAQGDSSRPAIDIKGVAQKDQQAELESIWEGILKSIKAVPQPALPKP